MTTRVQFYCASGYGCVTKRVVHRGPRKRRIYGNHRKAGGNKRTPSSPRPVSFASCWLMKCHVITFKQFPLIYVCNFRSVEADEKNLSSRVYGKRKVHMRFRLLVCKQTYCRNIQRTVPYVLWCASAKVSNDIQHWYECSHAKYGK